MTLKEILTTPDPDTRIAQLRAKLAEELKSPDANSALDRLAIQRLRLNLMHELGKKSQASQPELKNDPDLQRLNDDLDAMFKSDADSLDDDGA